MLKVLEPSKILLYKEKKKKAAVSVVGCFFVFVKILLYLFFLYYFYVSPLLNKFRNLVILLLLYFLFFRDKPRRELPDVKNKSPSRSNDKTRKSSKHKADNVTIKVEKEEHREHTSKPPEDDKKWGKSQPETKDLKKDKDKPNFEVSGKLAEETNTYNGVVIKYNEPAEARKPKRKWRLYPFKGDSDLPFIPIHRQSAYLFGRTRLIADIPIDHPSCSKQHAVLQYRLIPYKREDGTTGRRVRPYIIDLESSNGTFVNNQKVTPRCYVELVEKDVIKFGYSSREYVLLHEESKNDDDDYDDVLETND